MNSMDEQEVDKVFEEIVDKESEEAELDEWVKTHGIISLGDYFVGCMTISQTLERMRILKSHLIKLAAHDASFEMPITEDVVAVISYPDEETRDECES